jgi:formylglycine-generating enzyme required for sulfatase activity/pimeloyl-ACP methyl ester carboxylesterase
VAVLVVAAGALWAGPVRRARNRSWARDVAIPRLVTLAETGDWEEAYALAKQVERRAPGDSLYEATLPKFARRYRIHTRPEGAEVWRKAYDAPDSAWEMIGRTPLDHALMALSGPGGTFLDANRIRIRAPGYRTLDLVGMPFEDSVITLDRDDSIPPEMVRIGGGSVVPSYPGFANTAPVQVAPYLMDRFEVTNRDYRRFVDSGGYRRRELWKEPIEKDGRPIPWERAMAMMTDRTGRTGPATWEAGDYPSGKADEPVGGVSWYEAMAYARFAGKSLPTVVHWSHAASVRNSAWIVPASNFSGQGPVPVGKTRGISAFGTYDMAGNVREWCLNAFGGAADSQRFILGGGWDDPPYRFNDAYAQAPFDRSPLNGIRLVRYPASDSNVARASAPIVRRLRDNSAVKPVSDAVFAAYLQMYEYDRKPLEPRVLEKVDEGEWTRELVAMHAAYGSDTLQVYLYLPKHRSGPVPAVVFFPPGSAVAYPALPTAETFHFDYLLKSGRAVLYPVYKGTYQRRDSLRSDTPDSTAFWRDHVVMWAKDMRRAIDYLETRPEVTTQNLAYYGISWGGELGGLMPAVDPRIKVVLLQVAGLEFDPIRPEVDPVNYLPHIRVPTLMVNGRYDFYFPVATSQDPMFRLLGTPPDQKRHVVEEGSHFVPRPRLIQEMLAWLDRYQPIGR